MMKKKMFAGMAVIGIILTAGIWKWNYSQTKIKECLRDNIIRFHIRAKSDDEKDQRNKLSVRDAVIAYMSPYMENARTKEEAVRIIKENRKGIEKTANKVLRQCGEKAKVNVYLTTEEFPKINYGSYEFPEGIYDALRIDIGKAQGHNWWCVMFPDLCVTKDDEMEINQKAKKKMKKLLGEKTVKSLENHSYFQWLWK